MFRTLFSRSRAPGSAEGSSRTAPDRVIETRPPQAFAHRTWSTRLGSWLGASGWRVSGVEMPSSLARRGRLDAVAAARLDFADALHDIPTPAATFMRDRIAATRSLHELWHFRGDVFDHVSRRHDQAEAGRRLAELDRHFAKRTGRARRRDASAVAAGCADR